MKIQNRNTKQKNSKIGMASIILVSVLIIVTKVTTRSNYQSKKIN